MSPTKLTSKTAPPAEMDIHSILQICFELITYKTISAEPKATNTSKKQRKNHESLDTNQIRQGKGEE